MKLMSFLALTPGSGAMTMVVNLCAALAVEQKSVLGLAFGEHPRLRQWLQSDQNGADKAFSIERSRLGFAFAWLPATVSAEELSKFLVEDTANYDYVFILGLPEDASARADLLTKTDWLGLCVNLKAPEVLAKTESALACINDLSARSIDLLIPNQVNPLEWDRNAEVLLDLSELLGSEKLAEMIPFCERIHDLPATGGTVWELAQENLRFPFNQLLRYLPLN